MTSELQKKIARMIRQTGPMSLAEYMHISLCDPQYGYYQTQEALGKSGDFITAPEISQMFGELIGIWCLQVWRALGSPANFCLLELGPGNATLMKDLLRATKIEAEFAKAAQIHLLEASQAMRQKQIQNLAGTNLVHLEKLEDLPDIPVICIANEFFDALPVRQYVKQQNQWLEISVVSDEQNRLSLASQPALLPTEVLPKGHEAEPDGAIFEHAPAREAVAQLVANHIAKNNGAALFVDYGHTTPGFGDTFQAISQHASVDPMTTPGLCDLTSHVDFSALENAVTASFENRTVKPQCAMINQGDFLLNMGLLARAGQLGQSADENTRQQLQADVERLAAPEHMGSLFKVFTFSNPIIPIPGYEQITC